MRVSFPIDINGAICNNVDEVKKIALSDIDAICILGDCYFEGCDGVSKESNFGLIYYLLAASCNNTRAYNTLGYYYENGIGVIRSIEVAMLMYICSYAFGSSQGVVLFSQLFFNASKVLCEGYENEKIGQALLRYAYELKNDDAIYYCEEYYPEVLDKSFDYTKILKDTKILEVEPSTINTLKNYLMKSTNTYFRFLIAGDALSHDDKAYVEKLVRTILTSGLVMQQVKECSEAHQLLHHSARITGNVFSNVSNASTIYGEDRFITPRGHGFAAERANHIADKLLGKSAYIIGDDNAKYGADRLVNGSYIQSKYCSSGAKCIAECFSDGELKYITMDGSPMQIEVPSDMYDDAVKAMASRIEKGQVKGVTDPLKASDIVRKGHFTYAQAKNITKFGTVESLTYDAVNGAVIGGTTLGITAILHFAVSCWNGEDLDIALERSIRSGINVSGMAFATAVVAGQLTKAGAITVVGNVSEQVVKMLGTKASANLVNAFRSGANIYGASAMKSAQKMVGTNIITSMASVAVLSTFDVVNIFEGRISGEQFAKNIINNAASVAGGTVGWTTGAAAGASLGSIIPVFGTAVGGFLGGVVGAFVGSSVASEASNTITSGFLEDDAVKMISIVQDEFKDMASDYLLNAIEADEIIGILSKNLDSNFVKDMYSSSNRRWFARMKLEPIIEDVVSRRPKINIPNEELFADALKNVSKQLA